MNPNLDHRAFVAEVVRTVDLLRDVLTRPAADNAGGIPWDRPGNRALAAEGRLVSYIEVGVREGDSFAAVWDAVPTLGRVALVDTWGPHHGGTGRGSHVHIEDGLIAPRMAAGTHSAAVEFLDGDSGDMLPGLIRAGRSFDVVHIDADHSQAGATRDMVQGWMLTNLVMVVHDLFMPSVAAAIRAFATDDDHRKQIAKMDISLRDSGTIAFWRNR
jgi:hypothetical protein